MDFLTSKQVAQRLGVTVNAVKQALRMAIFTLDYTEADVNNTYTYKMSEVNEGVAGVTYDETVYTFEVTVGYGESGKKLEASVTKDGSAENAIVAEFVNIYSLIKPGDASTVLPWMILLFISGGAILTFVSGTRKKQSQF